MRVGSMVVCVNDTFHPEAVKLNRPIKGKAYTIREFIKKWDGKTDCVRLEEIYNKKIMWKDLSFQEVAFNITRFREIKYNQSAIEELLEERAKV